MKIFSLKLLLFHSTLKDNMNKYWKLFIILLISSFTTSFVYSQSQYSLGLQLGTHISASLKYDKNDIESFDINAGFTRQSNSSTPLVSIGYLRNYEISSNYEGLGWYFGARTYLDFDNNSDISIDLLIGLPLGITYNFNESPFQLFVEITPYFAIRQNEFNAHGVLGGRFYF